MEGDGPFDPATKRRRHGPKNALVYIMVRSGLRFSEASMLRWEDVDFSQRAIYVHDGKGGRARMAILPEEAHEILEPIRQKTGYITTNRAGHPIKSMKTLFMTTSRRSGIPIKGPHNLRHICGTYTLEATGDLRLTQNTLGHTQIKSTEIYTQISLQRLRAGHEAMTHLAGVKRKKPE